jgi:TPR repeat protein
MMKWISILALAAVFCFGAIGANAGPRSGDGRSEKYIVLARASGHQNIPYGTRAPARTNSQVATCDRLAADPLDPERRGKGVTWKKFGGLDAAISACRGAIREQPNARRLIFQLGRALHRKNRYAEAAPWYRKAANMGHMTSQNNLGFLYERGLGVQKNEHEAVRWYRLAARKGNRHAAGYLNKRGITY